MDAFLEWWEAGAITHQFFSIEIMREAFVIILRAFPVHHALLLRLCFAKNG